MAIKSDSNLPILTHDVVYSHRRYALNDKLPQAIRAIETTVEDHMRADAIMCMKSMTKASLAVAALRLVEAQCS